MRLQNYEILRVFTNKITSDIIKKTEKGYCSEHQTVLYPAAKAFLQRDFYGLRLHFGPK